MTAIRFLGLAVVLLGAQATVPPPPAPVASPSPPSTVSQPAVPRAMPPSQHREVPQDRLRELRADPAYAYDEPVVEKMSLWDRIKAAFWQLLANMMDAAGPDGTRWILWTIAIVAVGWAVSRMLRADVGGPFRAGDRRRPSASDPLLDVDDIADVDLETLLGQARATGDRRAEIRLRYLLLIQRLAAAGAVTWARDKTNRTYGQEVRAWNAGAVAAPFGDATRVFEYVWYGDYDATADRLGRFTADAETVEAQLGVTA